MTVNQSQTITRANIDNMQQRYRANLINSLSGFKSANLIGTRSENNIDNLCIVSSVFHVGANPPLLGMIMRPHTVVRDTLENIKATGVYTINHVPVANVEQAHQTSARYPSDISEFEKVGLSVQESDQLNAPYVAESAIKIGMISRHIEKISLNNTELVIGEIIEIIIPNASVLQDGYLDIEQAGSACISGLDSYHQTQRIDRLSYAQVEEPINSLIEKAKLTV